MTAPELRRQALLRHMVAAIVAELRAWSCRTAGEGILSTPFSSTGGSSVWGRGARQPYDAGLVNRSAAWLTCHAPPVRARGSEQPDWFFAVRDHHASSPGCYAARPHVFHWSVAHIDESYPPNVLLSSDNRASWAPKYVNIALRFYPTDCPTSNMRNACIANMDAVELLHRVADFEDAIYCDPPYTTADYAHYGVGCQRAGAHRALQAQKGKWPSLGTGPSGTILAGNGTSGKRYLGLAPAPTRNNE